MITNNTIAMIEAFLWDGDAMCVRFDGEKVVVQNSSLVSPSQRKFMRYAMTKGVSTLSAGSPATYGVQFGSGTTPANGTDYCLESPVSLLFSNPSAVLTNPVPEGTEYTVTFGVSTTEDVTISEVGCFVSAIGFIGSNAYDSPILIDRTVLETPITIKAGQSKQISYTIRVNRALV